MITADGQTLNQDRKDSRYKMPGYVRVTTALGVLDKGEDIKRWMYKFKSYKEMQEFLRLSAVRGSAVDDLVKRLIEGDSDLEIDPSHAKYIEAFLKWQQDWIFKPVSADEEVYDDDLKYVGTLDLCGHLSHNGKGALAVLDIKTGEPGFWEGKKTYRIYDSYHQQTAAYRHAKVKAGVPVEENWALRLFSDGNYKFEKDDNYDRSFGIFKHALDICHLRNGTTTS